MATTLTKVQYLCRTVPRSCWYSDQANQLWDETLQLQLPNCCYSIIHL